jgi:thiosulfate/3-mercaptopyruvate sulfurtransferase
MFKQTLLAVVIGLAYASPAVQAATQPAAMQSPAQPQARIIDTADVLAAIQRGAIVWDVRNADAYNKGHIPGAVNIGDIGKVLRKDGDEDYIALADMEELLGAAGIDPAREIVVYGDKGNPFVYFGLLTVEYLNGKQGRIYHGGIDDWKAAGNAVSTEPTKAVPVALKLTTNPGVTVGTKEVLAAEKRKGVQIVDVRTAGEYAGTDIRAIRGGHIPGAINIAFEQNWADPATPAKLAKKQVSNKDGMALKSMDKLKELYAGLNPNKETIVYCQSGVRASETATVLKDLGFKKVKVYDASWLGYGNTLDAPAVNVQFFNVGALNGKLAAMQKHIDTLESALAEAKAAK